MTSPAKAATVAFVKAHLPAARAKRGLVLAEGETLALESLRGAWPVEALLLVPIRLTFEAHETLRREGNSRGIAIREISDAEMTRLSTQPAPPPAATLLCPPERKALETSGIPARILVLDGLSDPGNAGTLLRCAAGFGVAVILTSGGVTPRNEKFLRASAGTAFHPGALYHGDEDAAIRRALSDHRVVLLEPRATESIATVAETIGPRFALVLGNEAHGVSAARWPGALRASIPQQSTVESLNVAMSGAIALYEFTRPR